MSKANRITEHITPQTIARWNHNKCAKCGKMIRNGRFRILGVGGTRTHPKYYHVDCYPMDSRPLCEVE